jgi:hypothetical protein
MRIGRLLGSTPRSLSRHPMAAETRSEALLREAARDLVDTLEPYRVLTRQRLAELSEARHWVTVGFEQALQWAVEHGLVRTLGPDLYELPRKRDT